MEVCDKPIPVSKEDPEVTFKGFGDACEMLSNEDTLPSIPSCK